MLLLLFELVKKSDCDYLLQIDFVVCVFVKLLGFFFRDCVLVYLYAVWDAWIGCDSSKQTQEGNDSADKKSCSIPLLEVTIEDNTGGR